MTSATCTEHVRHKAGCPNCRARAAERGRARTRAIAYGTHRGLQNPAPARAHVLQLRDTHGMSGRRIAEKAGVSNEVVRKLIAAGTSPLQPHIYDKILAVEPDNAPVSDRQLVPALGAARRLQALCARAHHIDKLAAELGVTAPTVARWRRMHTPTITVANDQAIRAVYRRLADIDGGDEPTRAYARSQRWAPPGAWDSDDDLDNPDASPDLSAVRSPIPDVLAGRLTVDALNEDERLRVTEYLIALRYSDAEIAARLGWPGGRHVVQQYRRFRRLPAGRRRGQSQAAGGRFQQRRRAQFLALDPAAKAAAIDRFDFDGETLARIAAAVGCSVSTVDARRQARRAALDAEADPIAVRRALEGKLPFAGLNRAEKTLLFRQVGGQLAATELMKRLRISSSTYQQWMAQVRGETAEAA